MMEDPKERFSRLRDLAGRYAGAYDRDFVSRYMAKYCGSEAKTVVLQADRLLGQTFTFEDRWDMEPCGQLCSFTEMRWDTSHNGDPEWVFMLNRHEYLHKLLEAYWLTGNMEYIQKLKWYVFHWIRTNPIRESGLTTRTIDTGIRCMSWQILLLHLLGEGLLDQEEAEAALECISRQYIYMRRNYVEKYRLSNWGVLQTTAICHGYRWFEEYLPCDGTREWAWKELEMQMELQVMPDGSHWEQSMMYHMEVLLACMKLAAAWGDKKEEENGCNRIPGLLQSIANMSQYALYAAAPDHRQIAQCDSDATDVRDVMVKAAVLTGDGQFKFGGYGGMDLDSAWMLGKPGILAYQQMKEKRPEGLCRDAGDTGNLYIRSGWEEGSHFTYLKCGALGSSHGHADLTHISLYYKGKPFLTDSGRYSYREDEPLRMALKSAQAHNVCVIDGESQGVPNGSWSYSSFGEALKNYYREQGPVHYAEMAYHGSLGAGTNYLVIRKVMVVDDGLWLIVNDIRCDGGHKVREYYHLDPGVEVKQGEGGGLGSHFLLENEGERLNIWGSEAFSIIPSLMSERYNELYENHCIVKETAFTDRLTDWTCLAGNGVMAGREPVCQTGGDTPADDNMVMAMRFEMEDGDEWILLIWNRETFKGGKMYVCRDVSIYARAAAVHIHKGHADLYRLRI